MEDPNSIVFIPTFVPVYSDRDHTFATSASCPSDAVLAILFNSLNAIVKVSFSVAFLSTMCPAKKTLAIFIGGNSLSRAG